MQDRTSLTFRDAGVDIDAGDELVDRIKPRVRRTLRPEVLGGIGGFGALVELPPGRWRHPVLVSGTDGVGTKLRLAIDTGRHDTVGIDLVAMCANDVVVQGAEPLFFLDYIACGKLVPGRIAELVKGVCTEAAAVTSVSISVISVGPPSIPLFRVERPFVFVIREQAFRQHHFCREDYGTGN